uniref:Cadherin domain-containing protein n=1 Tax=Ditylenchus dipsaci TaxID=166011 RepID=A0A915EU46_9BILA
MRSTQQIATLQIDTGNWSGSAPQFPVPLYRKFISEAAPIRSNVLRTLAVNRLSEESRSGWKYSLVMNASSTQMEKQALSIDESTADVFLQQPLDIESGTTHLQALISVVDTKGRTASVPLSLYVVGVDEFLPVFSKPSFTFQIPLNARAGHDIGQVTAADQDVGWGSQVFYSIQVEGEQDDTTKLTKFLRMDAESGKLYLRRALPSQWFKKNSSSLEQITVLASSSMEVETLKLEKLVAAKATVYLEPCPSSIISSQHGTGGSNSESEEHFHQAARCRSSQPDSGIISDPEAISLDSTTVNNYLTNVVGITPDGLVEHIRPPTARVISVDTGPSIACSSLFKDFHGHSPVAAAPNYESMSTMSRVEEPIQKRVQRRDSDLNDLLYAKIDEIIGPGPIKHSKSSFKGDKHSRLPTLCPTIHHRFCRED